MREEKYVKYGKVRKYGSMEKKKYGKEKNMERKSLGRKSMEKKKYGKKKGKERHARREVWKEKRGVEEEIGEGRDS